MGDGCVETIHEFLYSHEFKPSFAKTVQKITSITNNNENNAFNNTRPIHSTRFSSNLCTKELC